MNLLYKDDWEATKERFCAWWAGEYFGRCALAVTAPRDDAPDEPPPTPPENPVERWTDLDYITALNDWKMRRTYYGAEAFPCWNGGYPGHTSIPAFLGCPVTLDDRTGWMEPILLDEDWDVRALEVDRVGAWWRFTLDLLHTAAEAGRGKSIPSIGAFGGCGDTLASLRGTIPLLYDVSDCPERVRDAEMYLMDMWIDVYNEFYRIVGDSAQGSTCWFPLWAPGRFYATQNDFSYMISTKTFTEMFFPALQKQIEFLDYTVYHCDGVEAFRHIPALCELPGMQAVQVLPGAGKPSPLHYMGDLKTVQALGKNLHITVAANDVQEALAHLSARGLFISTACDSESEARELIRNVEKWSRP